LILAPTRIYVKPVLALAKKVPLKGIAHITGGGLVENIPRVLSAGLCARISQNAWPMPPLFTWLQQQGNVADSEMHRVFNCGIGLIIVVSPADASRAQAMLTRAGERVWRIGEVTRRPRGAPQTVVV
jgi:phosphoribosylformylglycinamidine cyclo-ligase